LTEQSMQALAPAQAYFASVLRRLGAVREPPFILDAMTLLTDRYLQLTIPSLEYPRSDAPAGLRFVGALPPGSQESSVLPEWWPDVLRAERVVVVTQGTISNKNYGELIEPTLRALAGADVLVVATLGRAANITNVPGNARVAAFVPFDALLPHTDVLVTNGGYGGVQLALGHGVPLVLAGVSEDKAEVTARVAWAGAGINLATQTPDEASIRNAVDAVLNTPRYRARARELQLEYARHEALGAIHATIADLLRDGRNSNP
jgi:UDP:flavonoid glycosyltransferase YjiC (YdhE family)